MGGGGLSVPRGRWGQQLPATHLRAPVPPHDPPRLGVARRRAVGKLPQGRSSPLSEGGEGGALRPSQELNQQAHGRLLKHKSSSPPRAISAATAVEPLQFTLSLLPPHTLI